MADGTTVNLDKAWLEKFLKEDVLNFREELRKILLDGEYDGRSAPSLANLLPGGEIPEGTPSEAALPLTIGAMVKDARTNGESLVESITKVIGAIDVILKNQTILFEDIEDNLGTSIEKLFKTQGDNLAAIDGQKLLDVFEDVDDSLGGGNDEDD
ncbi:MULTISPECIES: type VII secretion system-associated protein [unclassified Streptomyces]|uniref:type VII secretion system-associated protein n=1 Tax=unclassified Streptomyces TaxID=2593676 RepID=UPI0038280146